MPWISIRKSSIDPNGVSTFSERHFKKHDLIGVLLASKCDKHMEESHNKSVKDFNQHFVNCPGDKIERNIGLGMQCMNDRNFSSDKSDKNFHNCYFYEQTCEVESEMDQTIFLVHAKRDIHAGK